MTESKKFEIGFYDASGQAKLLQVMVVDNGSALARKRKDKAFRDEVSREASRVFERWKRFYERRHRSTEQRLEDAVRVVVDGWRNGVLTDAAVDELEKEAGLGGE